MSKVICDVCGTSYPETANQCPICGCVRSAEGAAAAESMGIMEETETKTYTYVKGGRFSKSNVKKRNRAQQAAAVIPPDEEDEKEEEVTKSSADKWLTAAVIILLLAIIAVVAYIAVNFFGIGLPESTKPADTTAPATNSSTVTTTLPSETDGTTEPEVIPCEALRLDDTTIELDKIGAASLLNIYTEPANTTDTFIFASSDESVATVTDSGKVVAVGSGQAVITITCGDVKLECTVLCNGADETTAPTTEPTTAPTTEPTTEPKEEFELNRSDFTLAAKGDSWVLYNGSVSSSEITWSSDNESVATVSAGGKVVAVGPGVTTIRAEHNGTKVSCIVRCSFTAEDATEPTTSGPITDGSDETTGGDTSTGDTAIISHNDVTIKVGESFNLVLQDSSGKTVSVTWVVSDSNVCSVSGSAVTGKASGTAKVYTTYAGAEYSCIVRVVNG